MHFLQQDGVYWADVDPFPRPLPADRFNKGFSNPKVDKIHAYLNGSGTANTNEILLGC
jgi:hypothetical protein